MLKLHFNSVLSEQGEGRAYVAKFRKKVDQSGLSAADARRGIHRRKEDETIRIKAKILGTTLRNRPVRRVSRLPPSCGALSRNPFRRSLSSSPGLPTLSAFHPRQTSDVLTAVAATTVITVDVFVPCFIVVASSSDTAHSSSREILFLFFSSLAPFRRGSSDYYSTTCSLFLAFN